ncbi:hypothetical protein NO2_0703 [Candidatus Termititenax persephonae]|uniref:Uncharacterized protein n=1 Tax=Candidatus Termititenax persephonae TaxID=2218525 RepID=A0A388TGZ6_9BACT|nr:hypothetical protein NO2_0703 [Candidatus Termititenax persephonae]
MIRPDSIYKFIRNGKTAYILNDCRGENISNLLGEYKRNKYAGQQYLYFDNRLTQKQGGRYFAKSLFSTNQALCAEHMAKFGYHGAGKRKPKANITGLNFLPENPYKSFGDFKDYAVLAEFSEDMERLTLYFFRDQKNTAETLFQKWLAGELVLAPDIKPMQV